MGGRINQVVMGGGSFSEGCGFESQQRAGHGPFEKIAIEWNWKIFSFQLKPFHNQGRANWVEKLFKNDKIIKKCKYIFTSFWTTFYVVVVVVEMIFCQIEREGLLVFCVCAFYVLWFMSFYELCSSNEREWERERESTGECTSNYSMPALRTRWCVFNTIVSSSSENLVSLKSNWLLLPLPSPVVWEQCYKRFLM